MKNTKDIRKGWAAPSNNSKPETLGIISLCAIIGWFAFSIQALGAPAPRQEQKSISAPDIQSGAEFGRVSISGNTLVVGAPYADNGGIYQGSAYVFDRNKNGANMWGALKTLNPSDATNHHFFGIATTVSGTIAVIGAYGDRQSGQFSGAAYLFERDYPSAGNWGERRKLTPSDSAPGDLFGMSLDLDGDTLAVGADQKTVGGKSLAGAVYIFQRDQGGANAWGQVMKLVNPDSNAVRFGYQVAISGDYVVVGDIFADEPVFHGGAVYIFSRHLGGPNQWGLMAKLSPLDLEPWEQFGNAVAIHGDTVAASCSVQKTYIFKRSSNNQWQQVKRIDRIGALALSVGTLVIGNADDGLTYLHGENVGGPIQWGQSLAFRPSDWAGAGDLFGGGGSSQLFGGVAISGRFLAAGSVRYNSGEPNSGRAYVFRIPSRLVVRGNSALGLLSATLEGPAGDYVVQGSEDLVQWSDIGRLTIPESGTVEINNFTNTLMSAQFYRLTDSPSEQVEIE